jgi:PTH1 family peptidyl-tRNA hydrolase
VPRLRIGIGPVAEGWKTADFVLGRFSKSERETVSPLLERAADAVEEWTALGIESAMNRYN